jgi:hypothetical protein
VQTKMGNTDVVGAVCRYELDFRRTVRFPSAPRYVFVLKIADTCRGAHPLFYSVGSGSQQPASEMTAHTILYAV